MVTCYCCQLQVSLLLSEPEEEEYIPAVIPRPVQK